jgi:UDP-N-acetylmuramoyl-L-alanyl-D-glutamate--2,6-diaminopimelate ligase
MNLRDLTAPLLRPVISGPLDREIAGISADSRNVQPGGLFVAVRGGLSDGHDHIAAAIAAGAVAIIAERAPVEHSAEVTWIHVADTRKALGRVAAAFFGHPSGRMKIVGVTGTNGKTTTTFLLHAILKKSLHRAGLLGTIRVDDGEKVEEATHTTPAADALQALLGRMADHGCRAVAMEVSSHGIDQQRAEAVDWDAAVFTNLTQDHLDYHQTMERYFEAKLALFEQLAIDPRGKKPVAVVNADDAYGKLVIERMEGRMALLKFGMGVHSDLRANNIRQSPRGTEFELATKGKTFLVRSSLIGRFNVYNMLAALGAAQAIGISMREAVAALADAPQVPGRMENVGTRDGVTVFVDYAHTPDALENACRTLRELEPERLVTVFGCGGDRDRGKRPLMAAAAARHSDACLITSDNPRTEDPEAILREVEAGIGGVPTRTIADRREAIRMAIHAAAPGDIVLIAGKGHENYQDFGSRRIHFDDREEARRALRDKPEREMPERSPRR